MHNTAEIQMEYFLSPPPPYSPDLAQSLFMDLTKFLALRKIINDEKLTLAVEEFQKQAAAFFEKRKKVCSML